MGWTFTHRDADMDDKAFFCTRLSPDTIEATYHHRGEQAVYMAVRIGTGNCAGKVLGVVALYQSGERDRCNYGYKLMEEGCEPYAFNCPPQILDLLSPVEELYPEGSFGRKHAPIWRQSCRQNHTA